MEKRIHLDDCTLVIKRIDCDTKSLQFYKNNERLTEVPSGYCLVLHLEEGLHEEEQKPFCGTFTLFWARSYSLRLNGVTKVRFVQSKNHDIQVF